MKNKIQTLILTIGCWLLSITYSYSQTQDWLWAKSAGGNCSEEGSSVCTDVNGNVYITGEFRSDTIIFGSYTLKNTGGSDIYLAKYNAFGNILWAKSAFGNSDDWAVSVCTDANGNVYVTGDFYSSPIIFGSDTLTNSGSEDMFLVKYDTDGNVLWAKSYGGMSDDYGISVCTDARGNVYVSGIFSSYSITFGDFTLNNVGDWDVFLTKYNSIGNVIWARSAGGRGEDGISSVCTDVSGNIYVTGEFRDYTIIFGNYILTNSGGRDMFIVKYNETGNVVWAKNAGGNDNDEGKSVCTDTNSNIYVTASFYSDTITFGNYTLTNAEKNNIFLVKYDSSGNVLWVKKSNGNDIDLGESVCADVSGNVFVSGYFRSDTIRFESFILTKIGWCDLFLVKYDENGNVVWAKSTSGLANNFGISSCTDTNGNVYVTGFFGNSSIIFGNYTLTNAGGYDIFLAKFGDITDTTGINQFTIHNSQFTIYPNPAKDIIYVNNSSPANISIFNLTGQQIIEAKLTTEKSINISSLNAGIYILQAVEGEKIFNTKIIKQ